jgi:hypothetical protein
MALTYRPVGVNEDGSVHFEIVSDSDNPHFLVTGVDVTGPITVPDGTIYDVTAPVIEVASDEHAGHLSHLIGVKLEQPGVGPDEFTHDCTDHCGPLKRKG